MDTGTLVYLGVVSAIVLACRGRLDGWPVLLAAHAVPALAILLLVHLHDGRGRARWRLLRFWYPVALVPLVFKANGVIVPAVCGGDMDLELLAWDRFLFGAHPAAWLAWLEAPWITEVLRVCWMSYFVLPFLVAVPLYRRHVVRHRDPEPFRMAVFALTAGWWISYLGYFLTPAIGPAYYPELVGSPPVAEHAATGVALETIWVLEGGGARDICPSGHVIIAVLTLWLAFRFRLVVRWILAPVVLGLVVGTIDLRFHYGVDVVTGLIVVAAVVVAAPRLHGHGPEAGYGV